MEIWKYLPNYEKYQVSNSGRVRSLFYNKERILHQRFTRTGYILTTISKDKKRKDVLVHQLVAEAFLNHNPKETGLVVNHINFDKTNNKLENLEIVTNRENLNRKHLKSSSQYTGVSFRKDNNKWRSRISINGKNKNLGTFKTEYEAHLAYENKLNQL